MEAQEKIALKSATKSAILRLVCLNVN